MTLRTNTSQLGRSQRESREMAESPILHDLPRIRSVAPAKSSPPPPYSPATTTTTTTTKTVLPVTDSYFVLQPHGPKPTEKNSIRSSYIEKSDTDIGIAITTPSPSSPSSIPSSSPYTPISPSLFPVPPSRASTPNVSIPTSRSACTLLSTTTRGCGSSLGDLSMAASSTSLTTPATTISSPASTPTPTPNPFSPKRACPAPRFQLMPSTPSPVYSPRCKRGSRGPRVYPDNAGAGGLYIETKKETIASKRLRLSKRQSACSEQPSETPRSPAYSGFWLEVPTPTPTPAAAGPRPGLGSRSGSGYSASSGKTGEETETEMEDADSISPILSRPALLKAFGTNTSRHSINVVSGGDYDTRSLSAMWFGETRKRAGNDYPCYIGPEPDFAVAVVRERQRRRRRARKVKTAGGAAVIAVLFIVAIVVGVSLSVR